MKEYIVLEHYKLNDSIVLNYFKMNESTHRWIIAFYKDSKLKILHRENNKPAIIRRKGLVCFYNNGKFLRTEDVT
jgi:hypothetical protein